MLNETKYYLVRAVIAHDFTPDLYACVKVTPNDIQRIKECLAVVAATYLTNKGMSGLLFQSELHPVVINETSCEDLLDTVYPELKDLMEEDDYVEITQSQYDRIATDDIPGVDRVSVEGVKLQCQVKEEKVSMYVCPNYTSDRYYLLALEETINDLVFEKEKEVPAAESKLPTIHYGPKPEEISEDTDFVSLLCSFAFSFTNRDQVDVEMKVISTEKEDRKLVAVRFVSDWANSYIRMGSNNDGLVTYVDPPGGPWLGLGTDMFSYLPINRGVVKEADMKKMWGKAPHTASSMYYHPAGYYVFTCE